MNKIIAVANHKGGVGKTSTVASLGSILAENGNKVLMVDLDTQANLSRHFMEYLPDRIIYYAIRERKDIPISHVRENLDLVPSGLEMAGIELEMTMMMRREYILSDLLKPWKDKYDYILLDCPPSLGLVVVNALTVADFLLVPMLPDLMSSYGLDMMESFCKDMQTLNPGIGIGAIFFNRYNKQENMANIIEEEVREKYGEKVLQSTIRKNVAVAEAALVPTDVVSYKPECTGAKDFVNLSAELLKIWESKK